METETFSSRLVGTAGCELVGPDGIFGWTPDAVWAAVIVGLLKGAEERDPCLAAIRHGADDLTRRETRPPKRR